MPAKRLTDRSLRALKPRRDAKPYDVADTEMRGLAARVMASGSVSFVFIARYPGSRNPTRRALGTYSATSREQERADDELLALDVLTLAEAREKARLWRAMLKRGKDPRGEEERRRVEQQRQDAATFASVVEEYIRDVAVGPDAAHPRQRQGNEVAADLRRVFIPLWGQRPVADITRLEVQTAIKVIRDHGTDEALRRHGVKAQAFKGRGARKRTGPAPAMARNLLGIVKQLFGWAVEQGTLTASPCADLKASTLVGDKKHGERILTDDELRALWRAATKLRYPAGDVVKVLMLSGLRLNEAADAAWPEIDMARGTWLIPAERMKGKNNRARPHLVSLTGALREIFDGVPRYKRGPFVFSLSFGETAVWLSYKVKRRLDRRMARTLKALARIRGEDPRAVEVRPWVVHDVRRSVRSGLAQLRVRTEVAEAVLAHARKGVEGVYDRHHYLDEKREALERWAQHLRGIVEPPRGDNVVKLERAR